LASPLDDGYKGDESPYDLQFIPLACTFDRIGSLGLYR
jgi:hypothetical protein